MVRTRGQGKQTDGKQSTPSKAAARKVKNKVGSPPVRPPIGLRPLVEESDVESDEFDYNEEEDSAPVETPSDADSAASSASSRARLPHNLQRQLLIDIQNKGGIKEFGSESEQALRAICDAREQLYGKRGSRLRVRIGKKVQRWKKLSSEDYLALFTKFRVTSQVEDPPQEDSKPAAKPSKPYPEPTAAPKQAVFPAAVSTRSASIGVPSAIAFQSGQSVSTVASARSTLTSTKKMSTQANTSKLHCHDHRSSIV